MMISALDFFLRAELQRSSDHPKGWDWYVLDSERLHQDILQFLIPRSVAFTRSLLEVDWDRVSCVREPRRGSFDLLAVSGEAQRYIEIKVFQAWTQADKQCELLSASGAQAAYIVLGKSAADLTEAAIRTRTNGHGYKVSYHRLYRAIDSMSEGGDPATVREFGKAYRAALVEHETRARQRWPTLES